MNNKIAVILPACKKDKPQWLRESVDSILAQTYRDFHLFIAVDGPVGDELQEALKNYEARQNITIVRFEQNRGLACVLNDLLEICFARGYEYVARMDADDVSLPERFEKQMACLVAHPEIDVVGGAINEINENGEDSGKVIVYPSGPEECRDFFATRNPHAHPAVMFRKSFFDKMGSKYRPEYRRNQDTMLWMDGMKAGTQHANIPDVVLNYRLTANLLRIRRGGWAFAKKQLEDRKVINKTLGYGLWASVFAYCMFIVLVSPAWVKKFAYRVFR